MTTISSGPASVLVTAGGAFGWLAAGGSDVTGGGATVQEHGGALSSAGSTGALLGSVLSDVAGRLGLFDAPGGDAGAEATGGGFGWGAAAPFVYQDAGGGDLLADLLKIAEAVTGFDQSVFALWADLLDVYRPSGQAALAADPASYSIASQFAASSLAQSPMGAL